MAVAFVLLALTAAQLIACSEAAAKEVDLSLIKLPPGFAIEKYAEVPSGRSLLTRRHNGSTVTYVSTMTLFTSDTPSGVWALVDSDSDGKVDYTQLLVDKLDTPNGIAMKNNTLYISGFINNRTQGVIWALANAPSYALNKTTFEGPLPVVTDKLPGDIWHGWRYMVNRPNSDDIYVAVGVNCNICLLNTTKEGIQFASIYAFNLVTKTFTQVASGVRNTVGLTVHPRTRDLWFTDNGRDDWGGPNANITDNLPDCELNVVRKESSLPQDYGYPFCASEGRGSPYLRRPGTAAALDRNDPDVNANGTVKNCRTAKFNRPMQAMGPHTAGLGLRFYDWREGANFPREWHHKLFVAQRGSWNRQLKIGYRVMVLTLNRATTRVTKFEEFATGWLQDAGTREASVKGRPVDVSQLPDGSLLVSGDFESTIYRIYYQTNATTGA
eukprot:gene5822-6063_t